MNLLIAAADATTDPPPAVTAWQTSGIVAAGALLAAVLTVLGNLFVERFRRESTDRRWLLDRRHEAYVGFIQTQSKYRRARTERRGSDQGL